MTEACILSGDFQVSRECSTSSQVLANANRALLRKIMDMYCANLQRALLRLGQNLGPPPGHQNLRLPVEQYQNMHQRG